MLLTRLVLSISDWIRGKTEVDRGGPVGLVRPENVKRIQVPARWQIIVGKREKRQLNWSHSLSQEYIESGIGCGSSIDLSVGMANWHSSSMDKSEFDFDVLSREMGKPK